MPGLNRVFIVGRLGNDPIVKNLPNTTVANFTVATSEEWKDKNGGGAKSKTEWHKICVYGKTADNCGKYLSKGKQVHIEGKIATRNYEKDGATHYVTEIIASNVMFLGDRGGQKQDTSSYQAPSAAEKFSQEKSFSSSRATDSIPF